MALFGTTKKKDETKAGVTPSHATKSDLSHVLRHARITEKASMHASSGVYVFDVALFATKPQIVAAVKKLYNVTPRMVRITAVPAKTKRSARTGKVGMQKGGKKAYVYLKEGDTIIIS